jgi:large subunit ribosomal protein L13
MEQVIDAKNKILGRIASQVAVLLQGKNKASFEKHILSNQQVKIINASLVKLSGKKLNDKQYHWHSGWPGGLKTENARRIINNKGNRELIRLAIYGMLPANKLRSKLMKNLIIEE